MITILRAAINNGWEMLLRFLARPGVQKAMKWIVAWRPVVLVRRAQKTRVAVGIVAFLFVFEIVSLLCTGAGIDLHKSAEHTVEGWKHSVARVKPTKAADEFVDYLKGNDAVDEELPPCPPGVTRSVKGRCITVVDLMHKQNEKNTTGALKNLPRRVVRVPGALVHTVDYLASQGAAWVVVLALGSVVLVYALADMPKKGQFLNPYAIGYVLLLLVVASLAVQAGLEVVLLFVQYTLASLGAIKMVEFALGIPEKIISIVQDWREAGGLMVEAARELEGLPRA